ncbi:baseplate J/gp47 family protein [Enterococcus casseliflavus]|uniref:baseplate J/gp47 family protein n=1 Tax=Enterococcus casseliflavus TaxID=37734 RepID=UPI0012E11C25|nr:baseplate J/gp47 family protein [Enterococcus casseliflavus]MUN75460.1 phage tail protein [Enterococcus casseliflavus]MUN97111.1 phage tail protein [Enterococcus casseliflavus]
MNPEEIGNYLEEYDYEYFINQALSKVPEGIDTREGSIIYDALAPTCYQLAAFIMQLKNVLLETFVVTATGECLDYRAQETGLERIEATKAIVRARLTREDGSPFSVAMGSRFSSIGDDPVYYTVIAAEEEGIFRLQAEIAGESGNKYIGVLLPLNNFNGLAEAMVTEILIPARDTETDEELRKRIIDSKEIVTFGGNITDYYYLTSGIQGVGAVQIYPVWNGGGTVRLVILDDTYKAANEVLVERVQQMIDPTSNQQGIGYAPIGHQVTVAAPTNKTIDVEFELTLNLGVSYPQLADTIHQVIEDYFDKVRRGWDERTDAGYECWVFRSQITAAILSVLGVANVQGLKLNGLEADVQLELSNDKQELPLLGEVKTK